MYIIFPVVFLFLNTKEYFVSGQPIAYSTNDIVHKQTKVGFWTFYMFINLKSFLSCPISLISNYPYFLASAVLKFSSKTEE